jgi:type IV secretory pathway VirB10-like protein
MDISNAAVGAIAALCVTAGGAAMYVATGSHQTPSTPLETLVTAATPGTGSGAPQVQTFVPATPAAAAPAPRVVRSAPPARRTVVREQPAEPARTWTATPAVEQLPADQAPRGVWSSAAEPEVVVERETAQRADTRPTFVELTVPEDSVLGLQLETSLTSETAEVEDEVVARVSRDVRVGDRVAIPSGAQVFGQVTLVERGGRLKERARIGIQFTSAVLADGTRIPLQTDTIVREGSSPGGESAAKIGGGAIGGAIIGGIIGGARGAVIGGSVGAGAGTGAVMLGGRNAATLPSGTPISARLVEPATVTIDY